MPIDESKPNVLMGIEPGSQRFSLTEEQAFARSQEVGCAWGAQAGEAGLRDAVTRGGVTHLRRATQTPFSLIFEARH